MLDVDRASEASQLLSLARTALDDPSGLPQDEVPKVASFGSRLDGWSLTDEAYREYAIAMIDEAMGLLTPA